MPSYSSSSGHYWGKDYKVWNGHDIEGAPVCDPEYYTFQIPNIPMYAQWGKDDGTRVRLSGILRAMN